MNRVSISLWKKSCLSLLGLTALAVLFHALASPAYSSEEVARLTDFSGIVIIQSQGDWGVQPEKGLPLYSMDRVVTRTGTAVVSFKDGATIEIKANSNLLIEELEKTGSVTRNLRLLLGKMLFKSGKGSSTKTNLQTPTAVCGLRGTAGTLSIGADGATYIQFSEGGTSYTVGDFLSGVAKDVPQELSDLNPAQRAAFVASAAADQAKNARTDLKDGKISDPQAAFAAAKAAKAAALAAKAAAEAMLNNPDPAIRAQAQAALDAANKALEEANKAEKKAIKEGANPDGPETYTDPEKKPLFDVPPKTEPTVTILPTTLTTTTTTTTSSSPSSSSPSSSSSTPSSSITPTTSIPVTGSMEPRRDGFLKNGGTIDGELSDESYKGRLKVKGKIKDEKSSPYHGPVRGTLGEGGSFEGYLSGVEGDRRWRGIFDSIYAKENGEVGFLRSRLKGKMEDGKLSASGLLKMSPKGNIGSGDLQSLMDDPYTFANQYLGEVPVPLLDDIRVRNGEDTRFGEVTWGGHRGYETKGIGVGDQYDPDAILGVWRYHLKDGSYWNRSERSRWKGIYSYSGASEMTGGYWLLGVLKGTDDFSENHLRVTGTLDYLDYNYLGEIALEFDEFYDLSEEGNQAVAGGTVELYKRLGFGGVGGDSLYFFNGNGIVNVGEDAAELGLAARENGYFFLAIGEYSLSRDRRPPYLQNSRLGGILLESEGVGTFQGFLGSVWKDDTIDGQLVAIRITSEGGAGILLGDASGDYFTDLGQWKVKGDLFYIPLATGLRLDSVEFKERDLAWTGAGSFASGGSISVQKSKGTDFSIKGENWGVWQTMQAGTYTYMGTPPDAWTMSLTHQSQNMSHWMEVEGSKWSAETLTAKTAGAWVNWDKAVNGVMGGQLKGTFNPADATWQAIASGAYLETKQFMNMIANGQTEALRKLNIPCIEIGRADLAGSGNNLNVLMKNVTFFAYSQGALPRIWATDNITGSYNGNPQPNISFSLSQVPGSGSNTNIGGNFTVQTWQQKSWTAQVDGRGTVGGHSITFDGSAVGNHADGILTGVGSGTSKKQ